MEQQAQLKEDAEAHKTPRHQQTALTSIRASAYLCGTPPSRTLGLGRTLIQTIIQAEGPRGYPHALDVVDAAQSGTLAIDPDPPALPVEATASATAAAMAATHAVTLPV